jgi:hypothetical protein
VIFGMDLEAIIYIIVIFAGLVGFIVRVARPRLWRKVMDVGAAPARGPAGVEPLEGEPAGERVEMTPQESHGTGVTQDAGLPAEVEPRTRARLEAEPAILPAPAPAAVDKTAAEREGAEVRGNGGWSRIMRLPPLKRAIVLSELLGKPKALSEERFP